MCLSICLHTALKLFDYISQKIITPLHLFDNIFKKIITQWLEIIAYVFVICKVEKISINLQCIYQNELANNHRTCILHPRWDASFGWTFLGFFEIFSETGKADNYNSDVNYNYYWHECYKRFAFFFYKNQKVFFNCSLVSLWFTHTHSTNLFSPFLFWFGNDHLISVTHHGNQHVQ